MFSSYVRTVKKIANGNVLVHAEIIDDRTQRTVRFEDYEGGTKAEIVAKAQAALQALLDNEQDATLNAAYVGKLIAQV